MFLMGDDHSTNAYTQQEEKLTEKSLVPEMDEILSSATSWDEFKNVSVMDWWCANELNNMFVWAQNFSSIQV